MNELQPVLDLLEGKFHWLPALITWIGAAKLLFHFVGGFLQNWAAALLVRIVNSPDPDDDHFLLAILDSAAYRVARFVLGLFSLPLPARADYDRALTHKTDSAIIAGIAIAFMLAAVAIGCASTSYNAQVFNTENLTADLARTATSEFNIYYHGATNGMADADLAKLNGQRDQLYSADRDLSQLLTKVDALRENYLADPSTNNLIVLSNAVVDVVSLSSNVAVMAKNFTPKK